MGESNDVPLDAHALKIPSAGVDVSESAIPLYAPPNMPKVSRYGRTIQRPRRLNVFNVTTVKKGGRPLKLLESLTKSGNQLGNREQFSNSLDKN
ncbi:hypothetical protein TNCV_1054621 [Trichonephila clavipes]|nr:hypothetical protein TNCV_1054621 [Trichonephila clavipes]